MLAVAPIITSRFSTDPKTLKYAQLDRADLRADRVRLDGAARLIRGQVLSLREREFILAARGDRRANRQILFKELLPNLIAPIVVSISLTLPAFVAPRPACPSSVWA